MMQVAGCREDDRRDASILESGSGAIESYWRLLWTKGWPREEKIEISGLASLGDWDEAVKTSPYEYKGKNR